MGYALSTRLYEWRQLKVLMVLRIVRGYLLTELMKLRICRDAYFLILTRTPIS